MADKITRAQALEAMFVLSRACIEAGVWSEGGGCEKCVLQDWCRENIPDTDEDNYRCPAQWAIPEE